MSYQSSHMNIKRQSTNAYKYSRQFGTKCAISIDSCWILNINIFYFCNENIVFYS